MPVYYYRVGKEDGSILTQEATAESEEVLRRELEDGGYLVLQLKKRRAIGFGLIAKGIGRKKQSGEEFLVFCQELLVLIKAGLPIVQSLDTLMERTVDQAFKETLSDVRSGIRGGKALSDAMSRHPDYFSELFCNSLRSGERTGALTAVLERYITYLKKLLTAKRQLTNAVTYPLFLLFFTMTVVVFLITYVVPSFTDIYKDFQASLPLPTLILINATRFIREYLFLFAGGAVAAALSLRAWYRTERGRMAVDGLLLRLPLLGKLIRGYFITTMSRTLSTILAGGIPMLQALDMVSRSVTNRVLSSKLLYVQERVRQGVSLADAVSEAGIMPAMTIRMIEVGEATGALETMLDDTSAFYEDEVNMRLQKIITLIEPAIMIFMGAFVAAIVIMMYLPIFEMAGAVK